MNGVTVVWRPVDPGHLDPVDVLRFALRVDLSGGRDSCWPWLGSLANNGYGRTSSNGRSVGAHRFSLELKLGRPLLPGMYACHTCDNPPCVNPRDLYEGTAADNNRDTRSRGRAGWMTRPDRVPRGSQVGTSKLREGDVAEIRSLLAAGGTTVEIARRFDVSHTTVSYIKHGKHWGHVS